MSESVSRYSIVERLTSTKLDIMDEIGTLDLDIINKQQALENAEKDLEQWNVDVPEDNARTKRQKERDIEKLKNSVDLAGERKSKKEQTLKDKISEIDKALEAIRVISATAPDPKDQV